MRSKQSGLGQIKEARKRKWIERITELHMHAVLFLSILVEAGVNEITEY